MHFGINQNNRLKRENTDTLNGSTERLPFSELRIA